MDDKQFFYVQNTDGRKFKMVIRGELDKLSVAKIRRYLKSYGVLDTSTLVTQDGMALSNDMIGEQFDLRVNTTLVLREVIDCNAHSKLPTENTVNIETAPSMNTRADNIMQNKQSTRAPTQHPSHNTDMKANMQQWLQPQEAWSSAADINTHAAMPPPSSSQKHTRFNIDHDSPVTHDDVTDQYLGHSPEINGLRQVAHTRGHYPDDTSNTTSRTNDALEDNEPLHNARQNVALLGNRLGVPLSIDATSSMTCSVGTHEDSGVSMLITYDAPTERLYLYSTLLTELPRDNAVKVKLYEILLEGSLLGREVCGGGIGISLRDELVVLTTTLPMRTCKASSLVDTIPSFVETVIRWRQLINELL